MPGQISSSRLACIIWAASLPAILRGRSGRSTTKPKKPKCSKCCDRASGGIGEKVRQFEREFAAFQGAAYGVTCTNGTTAIEMGLTGTGSRRRRRGHRAALHVYRHGKCRGDHRRDSRLCRHRSGYALPRSGGRATKDFPANTGHHSGPCQPDASPTWCGSTNWPNRTTWPCWKTPPTPGEANATAAAPARSADAARSAFRFPRISRPGRAASS